MRRLLTIIVLALFVAIPAFAEYTIILRDGTTYKAIEKWKIVNGQALITLEGGTQITLNPRLIDTERTEQANELGLGDARLINVEETTTTDQQQRSLGSVSIRRREAPTTQQQSSNQLTPQPGANVSNETISKFQRAYDNVGLFDASIDPLTDTKLKVSLTANNEDEVFKAISATAFLLANLNEVSDVQLLMSTLTGGSAGKFEMNRSDAKAITDKHIAWHSYYVQKVIY